MCAAKVIDFMEPPATMTVDQGFELIARCRRQLNLVIERHPDGNYDRARVEAAHRELDDFEQDLLHSKAQ